MQPGERFIPFRQFGLHWSKQSASILPVPIGLVRSRLVNVQACMVWAFLAYRAGANGRCFPSVDGISKSLNFSERQVRAHIKALKKAGLISTYREGDGAGYPNNYVFHWHPVLENVSGTPVAEDKGAKSRTLSGNPGAKTVRESASDGCEVVSRRVRDAVKQGCEIPQGNGQSINVDKECRSLNGENAKTEPSFAKRPTDKKLQKQKPNGPLSQRVTNDDVDRLASFIFQTTGKRCTANFARDVIDAAPRAESVTELISMFRQKIRAGYGPRSNGWFPKVVADQFGTGDDGWTTVAGFKTVNPLTGIPTSREEFDKLVELTAMKRI